MIDSSVSESISYSFLEIFDKVLCLEGVSSLLPTNIDVGVGDLVLGDQSH
jgi:hypothetical protein